jgi:hypothetical protein
MHRASFPVLLALLLPLAGVTGAWGEALQADLSGYEEVLPVSSAGRSATTATSSTTS